TPARSRGHRRPGRRTPRGRLRPGGGAGDAALLRPGTPLLVRGGRGPGPGPVGVLLGRPAAVRPPGGPLAPALADARRGGAIGPGSRLRRPPPRLHRGLAGHSRRRRRGGRAPPGGRTVLRTRV